MNLLCNLFKFGSADDIGEPPWEYNLLVTLEESQYPKYLEKLFKRQTGKKLNLKHPKTFNEKIQWLKLYDNIPLKSDLTDKVKARDWVKSKIGEEYLKPVLWIGQNFDEIPFDKLPNSFIIKTNHGCKWQYKIKSKEDFLKEINLYNYIKNRFDGWMKQTFFPWGGLETQYKTIKPQLLIEPILIDDDKSFPIEYEIYCFNSVPKIYQKVKYTNPARCCVYDEDFQKSDITLNPAYIIEFEEASETLKKAAELSKTLSKQFKLVRVDWLLYNNKIYFNEMTFTPFSGFFQTDDKTNLKLGKMLKLK